MATDNPAPFISVQLPDEMKRYLTIHAAHMGVTRSELVRLLIQQDIKRHPDVWELAKKKGKRSA
jgi:predicted DNA-binding protein